MINHSRLKEIYLKRQGMLLAQSGIRFSHPGTDGDYREFNWVEFFKGFLPSRYKVSPVLIIDSEGTMSEQIDLAIYDSHFTPPIFQNEAALIVPVESVYAIFEIKPKLSKENFEYSNKKIQSVLNLKRTSKVIYHNEGSSDPKAPLAILGGILSDKSELKHETIVKHMCNNNLVDIACTIESGLFWLKHDKDFYKKQENVNQSKVNGDFNILSTPTDEGLISLFIVLVNELQERASVPAIDMIEYGKGLKIFEGEGNNE